MRQSTTSGINSSFPELSLSLGQVAYVLRTRSPLSHPRIATLLFSLAFSSTYCYAFVLARLACLNHAASVHSEPESNSPYKISYILSEKINPFSLRISTSILGLFLLSIKSSLRIRPRRHMRRFAQSYLVNISQRTLPLHLFWKRPPIKNPFL